MLNQQISRLARYRLDLLVPAGRAVADGDPLAAS